jgi:hypothetical protein
MKNHLVWTHVGTAIVSFALGWALTPKSSPSQGETANSSRATKNSHSISSSNEAGGLKETIGRTQVAKRDENKKPSEPRISLPTTTIANIIRGEKIRHSHDFEDFQHEMEQSLTLLGTSEREKNDVLNLLKKTESEIHAEEQKRLKAVQTEDTEIRLDNRAMEAFAKTIAPKIQEGIRASLPADLADVLISSSHWDQLYPTGENSFPTFTIARDSKGNMMAKVQQGSRGAGRSLGSESLGDSTPIPADQVFHEEHWKPFLKGLTLLPKDEE